MFKKTLYYREYFSPVFWGNKPEHKVKSYVEIKMCFDFKEGLRFTVSAPNVSWCYRNPLKALLRILEHESIGMAKYNKLKEDIRRQGLDRKLDCGTIKFD
jgi:hypothetical protein